MNFSNISIDFNCDCPVYYYHFSTNIVFTAFLNLILISIAFMLWNRLIIRDMKIGNIFNINNMSKSEIGYWLLDKCFFILFFVNLSALMFQTGILLGIFNL